MIQTVSVPGGSSTTSAPFSGKFGSWFLDGGRFITTSGTTVLVYSAAGTQQAVMGFTVAGPFVGQGNWLWADIGATLEIFPVGSSSNPVASLTINSAGTPIPSGTTLAAPNATNFAVIDLSGTTLSQTQYSNYDLTAYAAASTSQWMLSTGTGVLLDGASLASTPRYFDYGAVSSIAGSNGSIAVATASGRVVYFNANTLTDEGVIPISATELSLSSDGAVLAASESGGLVGIYSLPSAGLLHTWSNASVEYYTALSGSGTVLAESIEETGAGPPTYSLTAAPATGGSPILTVPLPTNGWDFAPAIYVSPNGTWLAMTTGVPGSGTVNPGTNIWNNGTLATAVTGVPIGWIDDNDLLVNTYTPTQAGPPAYAACSVYSTSGQSTGPCALPEVDTFQTVTSGSIYAGNLASILSVSTGNVIWTSGDSASLGAVADNHIVFLSGLKVLAQGY